MKNGDTAALEEFYDRHAPRVLGMLVRMLPTRGDADDVLQEVFWQVWKRAEKYDASRGKPITWLSIIARYQAIGWLRRYKSTVDAESAPELTSSSQPTDEAEQAESVEMVNDLLNQLPTEPPVGVAPHQSFETTWFAAVRDIEDPADDHGHMVLFDGEFAPNQTRHTGAGADRGVSANHAGLAQFAFLDGSVHTIPETIDLRAYRALCSIAGSEIANKFD